MESFWNELEVLSLLKNRDENLSLYSTFKHRVIDGFVCMVLHDWMVEWGAPV